MPRANTPVQHLLQRPPAYGPAGSKKVFHVLVWLAFSIMGLADPGYAGEGAGEVPLNQGQAPPMTLGLSSLNVRLSSRPIRPPGELVKKVVVLEGIGAARPLTGEPTLAAVLEDDDRNRVIVLSVLPDHEKGREADGRMRAYLLQDVDLESRLPQLTACSNRRRCADDRTPGVGGLGCVAFCLVEALRP